ncbi:hypothetical protein B0H16DRAFT_1749519 [Mycena metata]|uniref:Peroxisomal biogenesis factor 11 n=1 Tax=Mycena metata TaxID=1033252 RepID=A0AAD7DTL4_9AGAR|nr:hypothetical protein B0H16DRAFT_1749519 [Mycena metata]
MSSVKNGSSLAIDDLLLGFVGSSTPPSQRLNHAIRYFSTWSGTDKLMMTTQYTAKLLAPFLLYRAELQFRAGKRAQPLSLTTDGLYKFAGQLSQARRIMGFWGLLAILKGLSDLERSPPRSRLALNIGRLQGLSMLVFYPLEYISFFSAPFSGPLLRISPAAQIQASLWSVRAWGVWVALKVVELVAEWNGLLHRQREARINYAEDSDTLTMEHTLKMIEKRKKAIKYQLFANISRLPVITHWSVVGGIYQSEYWTNVLSLISALAAFRGGWESNRVPGPMK